LANNILTDLEFDERISKFPLESQFLARQVFTIQKTCCTCQKRIGVLENRDKRLLGVVGGGSGFLGGVIVAVIEYFRR